VLKSIEIFLGNKLVSCDTIVPLMMSLQKINKGLEVNYSSFDNKSVEDIKKNELLYSALKHTGKIYLRGSSGSRNFFIKKILKFKAVLFLVKLFLKLSFGRVKIIHFGIISVYPFKLLELFFPNNIYYMEHSCFLKHKNAKILDNLLVSRNTDKAQKIMSSKNILYFNKLIFKDYNINFENKTLIKNPRTYRTWYEYITGYGIKKVKSQLEGLKYDYDKGYFVYILGHIGNLAFLESKNTIEKLIPDTLKLLSANSKGLPVLIKPHSITDMNILNKILNKNNFKNVHITYLHTAALSINAKLVVSNYFSLTQGDAHFFGAKTVEYTHYSKFALEKTFGESINPYHIDHFINKNPLEFKKIIDNSLNSFGKNEVKNIYEDTDASSEVRNYLV